MSSSQEVTPTKKTRARSVRSSAAPAPSGEDDGNWSGTIAGLSYQQARTAMDLAIAQLQAEELEVEQMVDLYRRALAYAERCEQVLATVEQEVLQLEPGTLSRAPSPNSPS